GGGGHGGVAAGNGSGPSDGGDPSDAVSEAAAAMQDLGDLAREHQDEIDSVAGTLEGAGTPEEREAFKEAAKEHADAVRDAIKDLPPRGPDAASAESAAAEGRDQAEAMAGALERGDASGAVEAGKRAVASLAEAKRLGDQAKGFFPEQRAGQKAAEARGALDRELAWAEDALEKLRKAASGRVKGDLDEHAKREKKLGERAESLAKKGDEGDGSMPEEMIDHLREAERRMKDAEQALRQGDGQGGLDREREAQRLLEMAQNDATQDKEPQQPSEHEGGKNPVGKADVPGKDKHKGPEDFRKRVVEGLSGASDPALRDAVKRYAEGLLK
ncbi:MAG TPA: DUF4175 domain-containing protein, partial [Minicystis sp.]|nr:DUF4175 domain-containing protein [Minicystis sp.]